MTSTNARFVQDVNSIIQVQRLNQTLLDEVEIELITAVRGIGDATEPPKEQSGGIASPLKEIAGSREYHEPDLITSSDGLFVIEHQAIKKAVFEDANGEQVVIEFQKQ